MKKIICVFMCVLLFIFCFGCAEKNDMEDSWSESNYEKDNLDNENETNNNELATTIKESNEFTKTCYVDKPLKIDLLSTMETYVLSDAATDGLQEIYASATQIETLPVFGPYLEETNLVVYLFIENDQLKGTTTLHINETLPEASVQELSQMTDALGEYVEVLSDKHCYSALQGCMENHPDFDILGVVYNTIGYNDIYPIGITEGKSTIQYMAGSPTDFSLVDPFTTIAEGRVAFQTFLTNRAKLRTKLSIFQWEGKTYENTVGYINLYSYSGADGQDKEDIAYLYEYDNKIVVPLLNEKQEEDEYILHLLFYHDILLAEIVIQKSGEGAATAYQAVWQRISEKNVEGKYTGLVYSEYETMIQTMEKTNDDFVIEGVMFTDRSFRPFGTIGSTAKYYDTINDRFVDFQPMHEKA